MDVEAKAGSGRGMEIKGFSHNNKLCQWRELPMANAASVSLYQDQNKLTRDLIVASRICTKSTSN